MVTDRDRKKLRTADFADVDKALIIWFKQARSQQVPISGHTHKHTHTHTHHTSPVSTAALDWPRINLAESRDTID